MVPEDNLLNRDHVGKGGGYLIHNKSEIIHKLKINDKDTNSWIIINNQTVLTMYRVLPENDPTIMDNYREKPFPNEGCEKCFKPDNGITTCSKFSVRVSKSILQIRYSIEKI